MANAKKLPSGAWRTQASKMIDGKKVTKSFTVNPKACPGKSGKEKSQKAKALSELKAREWQAQEEYKESYGLTVNEAMDIYVRDREKVVSPATVHTYRSFYKYFAEIGEMNAEEIKTPDIQRIINMMAVDVCAKTIKSRVSFLLSALDYAGNEHKFKLRYPQQIKREPTTPDISDVSVLLNNAGPNLKAIICLAAFGTMRRGEIAGLKGKYVLRDKCTVLVRGVMVIDPDGKFVYKEIPKTSDSARAIRFPESIMDLIPETDSPEDLVFNATPVAIVRRYERLRARLGYNFRFHDLRHFAASFRSDLGIPGKYIEETGGWSKDSSVLADVYDNALNSAREKYIKMTNDFIDENFGDELSDSPPEDPESED